MVIKLCISFLKRVPSSLMQELMLFSKSVKIVVMFAIQNLFFDENAIIVRLNSGWVSRVANKAIHIQCFCRAGDRLAFLISGVIQHQSNGPPAISVCIGNFFEKLAENVLVNIGIVGYRNGLMRDRVIGA